MTHHDRRPETAQNEEYLARHDWGGQDSLYESVIDGVVTVTGVDSETVAARYSDDHSRSVERLFAGPDHGLRSYGVVRFTLFGSVVTVHSDGRLIVTPRDGGTTGRSAVA